MGSGQPIFFNINMLSYTGRCLGTTRANTYPLACHQLTVWSN